MKENDGKVVWIGMPSKCLRIHCIQRVWTQVIVFVHVRLPIVVYFCELIYT